MNISNRLNTIAGDVTSQLRLLVMSKQQQAPGDLEHVRAFVNTVDRELGFDELATPAALVRWLSDRRWLSPTARASKDDLLQALALREALRSALLANNGGGPVTAAAARALDRAARRGRVRMVFDSEGRPALEPEAGGVDGALGRLLAIVHSAAGDGRLERLKACRDEDCAWAFYDHTKNRSGAWCNMAVCGTRAKARAYRRRQATASGS
jgi:predicted RNA-binding Zn ribbon-like protein